MKKKHLLFALFCSGLLSCTAPTATQQLAGDILADQSFHTVDSMARAVIRSGFNAGSGYSQKWPAKKATRPICAMRSCCFLPCNSQTTR